MDTWFIQYSNLLSQILTIVSNFVYSREGLDSIAHIVYLLTLCLLLLSTEELWLMSICLSLVSMYLIDIQWIFNVFYSISMVSPITPKGYIFPHDFPFFSLYPVTAAVKVPMHDSDLHHAGKEEIARLPTVRQGVSGRC